mmetsp:Transcript_23396/g.88845  ORF Transcript_23396/g.88845 Transcript_23396/m.88845 type:complete len:242 (-) Transcript_23396:1193-1918(-)
MVLPADRRIFMPHGRVPCPVGRASSLGCATCCPMRHFSALPIHPAQFQPHLRLQLQLQLQLQLVTAPHLCQPPLQHRRAAQRQPRRLPLRQPRIERMRGRTRQLPLDSWSLGRHSSRETAAKRLRHVDHRTVSRGASHRGIRSQTPEREPSPDGTRRPRRIVWPHPQPFPRLSIKAAQPQRKPHLQLRPPLARQASPAPPGLTILMLQFQLQLPQLQGCLTPLIRGMCSGRCCSHRRCWLH